MTRAALNDRALVRVTGADWRTFLQGLLTQDVETLQPGELRYGALLTPQGRLRFDMFLLGEAEGVLIDVSSRKRDELIQALTLYRLRAKVTISSADDKVGAAWGEPPANEGWLPDPRLSALGWRSYGRASEGGGDYNAHTMNLGVLDPSNTAEPFYPIEANLDLLNGIDFKKGCFVGQETTSRMKRRGQIKNRVAPVGFDGPPPDPGAEVLAGERRAGVVVTALPGRALVLFRIDRAAGAAQLTVADREVRLHVPEWLATAFAVEAGPLQA